MIMNPSCLEKCLPALLETGLAAPEEVAGDGIELSSKKVCLPHTNQSLQPRLTQKNHSDLGRNRGRRAPTFGAGVVEGGH